jgi:hypothetical protein
MQPHADYLKNAQAHLLESAEIKCQVAEKCLDSILAAADLIAEKSTSCASWLSTTFSPTASIDGSR